MQGREAVELLIDARLDPNDTIVFSGPFVWVLPGDLARLLEWAADRPDLARLLAAQMRDKP